MRFEMINGRIQTISLVEHEHDTIRDCWYRNGEYHRDGAPAIVHHDGSTCWYRNGLLHRDDGPAVEHPGYQAWYQDGLLIRTVGSFDFRPPSIDDWDGEIIIRSSLRGIDRRIRG